MSESENKPGRNINIKIGNGKGAFNAKAGGFYFVGFLGAAVYFISKAPDFWTGVVGVLKALVWPGILVFEALSKLGA